MIVALIILVWVAVVFCAWAICRSAGLADQRFERNGWRN